MLSENVTLATERGESITELEAQSVELVRLSARFHALGRQISEAERQKFAATFLQAVVRGFLQRMRNRHGIYSLQIFVKKLRHDPDVSRRLQQPPICFQHFSYTARPDHELSTSPDLETRS